MPRPSIPRLAWPRLLADVGGTHCRFALAREDGSLDPLLRFRTREVSGPVSAFGRAVEAARSFDARSPAAFGLAIASPLAGDRVSMVNAEWRFSVRETSESLGVPVAVMNDFVAQAFALGRLDPSQREPIGSVRSPGSGPAVILGAGTGLGVGIALPEGDGLRVLASEAGHATAAACDPVEDAVIAFARERFGHVSFERLVSGPGLELIHDALVAIGGFAPARRSAPEIGALPQDPHCRQTLTVFAQFLGTIAADLALTLGTTGGVFLTGGVVAGLGPAFDRQAFRTRFEHKGRYSELLATIPSFVVRDELAAFRGIAHALERLSGPRPLDSVVLATPEHA